MEYRKTEDGILGKAPKPCILCCFDKEDDLNHGKFYVLNSRIYAHYYCLLFSCNLPQNGQDNEGILGFLEKDIVKEAKRGQKIKCCYCHEYSSTIGCSVKTCKRQFHRICGLENGALYQFNDTFKAYCAEHKPRQEQEIEYLSAKGAIGSSSRNDSCPICYNALAPSDNILWAPCCRKGARFHKHCLQLTALSFGYFFKCPLCNEKDKFREVMQNFGIFIPNQDAAWELEGRFVDLERDAKKCDAQECLCPKGRDFHCARFWYIKTCDYCGFERAHVKCVGVSNSQSNWYCKTCKIIKAKKNQEVWPLYLSCSEAKLIKSIKQCKKNIQKEMLCLFSGKYSSQLGDLIKVVLERLSSIKSLKCLLSYFCH
ncbi:G2/M phase-specific E3 ubiquitin-protein ligase-like [Artemia franciscana]|uniref:G2/M phase-specific E3 ubiquitin-protein ligase-like n=1 Tax=Artemia franciscana TaxID=6661 RepID=UPI0032DBC01D